MFSFARLIQIVLLVYRSLIQEILQVRINNRQGQMEGGKVSRLIMRIAN